MDSNAVMDSYDSTLGAYGVDGNVGSEANVGTNATGTDSINLNSNAEIKGSAYCSIIKNESKDPTKVVILGTDGLTGNHNLNSNAEFYGAIYAPKADLTFDSDAHFYGAISAKTVKADSNVQIHYDKALVNTEIRAANEDSPCTVRSWQEKY